MTASPSPILPGRLGSPDMVLRTDPRADPRMLAAMSPFELDLPPAPAPVDGSSPLDQLLEFAALAEPGFDMVFSALVADLPAIEGVTSTVQVIRGIDGNDITLFIHRPENVSGPLPAVLHLHRSGTRRPDGGRRRL